MIAFSASEMIRDLRSGPATIRSSASVNSDVPITLLVAARGEDRRLVDEVGEIGAGSRRLTGDGLDLDLLVERLALRMDLEDRGCGPSCPGGRG